MTDLASARWDNTTPRRCAQQNTAIFFLASATFTAQDANNTECFNGAQKRGDCEKDSVTPIALTFPRAQSPRMDCFSGVSLDDSQLWSKNVYHGPVKGASLITTHTKKMIGAIFRCIWSVSTRVTGIEHFHNVKSLVAI